MILLLIQSKLIETALEKLPSNYFWYFIPFVVLGIILYKTLKGEFRYILNFRWERKKNLLELLKTIEETNFDSQNTKVFLKDSLENDIFQKQTKIKTSSEMRSSILKFYYKNNQEISWNRIKGAWKYFKIDANKNAYIQLSRQDKMIMSFQYMFLIVCSLLFILFYMSMIVFNLNEEYKLLFLSISLCLAVLEIYVANSYSKRRAANIIQKLDETDIA